MRYGFIQTGALACALMVGGCSSSSSSEPPGTPDAGDASAPLAGQSFVLVHGAWMGAWGWSDVASGLTAKGASVSVVELPAHGADTTPASGVTLDAYVQKVGAAIDAAGQPVTLVGHSMAGAVVTGAAEQKPASVSRLVYLAAYVPRDGQSVQDLANTDADSHVGPVIKVDMTALTAAIPSASLPDVFCADCDPAHLASLQSHYRDEPVVPLGAPVHSTAANWGSVKKFYIYTQNDHAVSPKLQQTMTAGVTWQKTATLPTSHSPFLSSASAVVETLVTFATTDAN